MATPGRSTSSNFALQASPRSRSDGRLYPLGNGLGFAGSASVDSNDPKNLVAWLAGHAVTTAQYKPWRAKGDVTLRADRIAVEHLRTEFDRGVVEGSLSYAWPSGDRPARLRWRASRRRTRSRWGARLWRIRAVRPGAGTARRNHAGHGDRPRQDRRLRCAQRCRAVSSSMPADLRSNGSRSETSGDTSFVATGRIQTQSSPGGSITVNLDARDLNGVLALSERFAPALADPLRRLAARQKTATLQASVSMASSGADGASGKIGLTGKLGADPRQHLRERDRQARGVYADRPWARWRGTSVTSDGIRRPTVRVRCLGCLALIGFAADGKPSDLDVSANGPLGRELRFEGKLAAGPIDAGGKGHAAVRRPICRRHSTSISSRAASAAARCRASGALRFDDVPRLDGSIEAENARCTGGDRDGARHDQCRRGSTSGWSTEPLPVEPDHTHWTHRLQSPARRVRTLARGAPADRSCAA